MPRKARNWKPVSQFRNDLVKVAVANYLGENPDNCIDCGDASNQYDPSPSFYGNMSEFCENRILEFPAKEKMSADLRKIFNTQEVTFAPDKTLDNHDIQSYIPPANDTRGCKYTSYGNFWFKINFDSCQYDVDMSELFNIIGDYLESEINKPFKSFVESYEDEWGCDPNCTYVEIPKQSFDTSDAFTFNILDPVYVKRAVLGTDYKFYANKPEYKGADPKKYYTNDYPYLAIAFHIDYNWNVKPYTVKYDELLDYGFDKTLYNNKNFNRMKK